MSRSWIVAARRAVIVLAAVVLPFTAGFIWFANNLPKPVSDDAQTDAIVVLTGGSDRISTGVALLASGRAKRLFVSGVHREVDVPELFGVAHASPAAAAADPALASRIDLGHGAGDTVGNAVETAEWMHANHFSTMRLVTADYHMRRALLEFRITAPDIAIWPNPVRPPSTGSGRWWRDRSTFDLLLAEYGKYLVARWRYVFARLSGAV